MFREILSRNNITEHGKVSSPCKSFHPAHVSRPELGQQNKQLVKLAGRLTRASFANLAPLTIQKGRRHPNQNSNDSKERHLIGYKQRVSRSVRRKQK
ncbi:hypothetical protein AVEN_192961-1 [Araneus ventricosus]|uniref:Uncharacterized protein n=1 Tax=Araneus ventricosus TaxID=182803 RepID=A0A4Y2TDC7_ARAVE|nr:hypothetical protein AVEN_192961-1 [Araneus ventricosus]